MAVPRSEHPSKPQIGDYPFRNVSTEKILESLAQTGACAIRGLLGPEELAEIEKETGPYLNQRQEWRGEFFTLETRKCFGLAAKSPSFLRHISFNPLFYEVSEKILGSELQSWNGEEYITSYSPPQFSTAGVLSIAPGGTAQGLHRDDMVHHARHEAVSADQYTFSRETMIGLFVAGTKTTKENGATRLIPGSHLMDSVTKPDDTKSLHIELNPGDAFIMLCSVYHGGSANTTKHEQRLLYTSFLTRGYLRQNENQYLVIPLEQAKTFDEETLRKLGYAVSPPFLGWVDGNDPMTTVFGKNGQSTGDLY